MAVSFSKDILPLFTPLDIEHMSPQGVLLNDYGYMSDPANAASVYEQLSTGQMPPPGSDPVSPWPAEWIQLFQDWIQGGFQP